MVLSKPITKIRQSKQKQQAKCRKQNITQKQRLFDSCKATMVIMIIIRKIIVKLQNKYDIKMVTAKMNQ